MQERDLAFLQATWDYRLLSTPQFLRLFPDSADAVYRRLQRLFHHGYLDRLKGPLASPIVYALGLRGAEILRERGLIDGWPPASRRDRADRYVAHQGMIVDFRIHLVQACRTRDPAELLFFRAALQGDREAASDEGAPRPDGCFALRYPARPEGRNRAYFFLEADRSTMTRARFIEKLHRYEAWSESGAPMTRLGIRTFRVLTVTRSQARASGLIRAARQAGLGDALRRLWFTTAPLAQATLGSPGASILGPVWQTAAAPDRRQSLIPE